MIATYVALIGNRASGLHRWPDIVCENTIHFRPGEALYSPKVAVCVTICTYVVGIYC